MNTIAIMQPYFFPYIGYWQLIHAVDRFVIFDDVNFINKGWVNRNRLLINGVPTYFTAPLAHASQNKRICDIEMDASPVWRKKLVRTVEVTYRKAPCFAEVFPVMEKVIRHDVHNLADYLSNQLRTLSAFMGIDTTIVSTSRCYENGPLSGQERILDICKQEKADIYVNAQGGRGLYDSEMFRGAGIDLRFIAMQSLPYEQRGAGFVPGLSIIDALMEIGPTRIRRHLDSFDLVAAG